MKRIIAFFVVCVIVFSFAGCTPIEWDSEAYEIGQKGLDILKKLNAGDITRDTAADALESFSRSADKAVKRIKTEVDDNLDLKLVWAESVASKLRYCADFISFGNYDSLQMEQDLEDLLSSRR